MCHFAAVDRGHENVFHGISETCVTACREHSQSLQTRGSLPHPQPIRMFPKPRSTVHTVHHILADANGLGMRDFLA